MIPGISHVMKRQGREARRRILRKSPFFEQHLPGWELGAPSWARLGEGASSPVIVAVGSGKGGVGKSLITANLGAQIASEGYRCLLIDMDLGSANLHTYFGFARPQKTLSDFLNDEALSFQELIIQGPIKDLGVVAGGRLDERSLSLKMGPRFFTRFWQELQLCRSKYKFDFVLLDLGAGTHGMTLELFSLAHVGLISILPEPTSIENAYVFLRAYLWRLIENLGENSGMEKDAAEIQKILGSLSAQHVDCGYLATLKEQHQFFPEFIEKLGTVVLARKVGLLVNQVRSMEDRAIVSSMEDISRRFFGLQSHSLGYLNFDDTARQSLRNHRLLLLDFPHSLIVQRIKQAAQNLLALCR